VHGPWTYGHFCGAGGMGTPINGTDAACQQHDACYAQTMRDRRNNSAFCGAVSVYWVHWGLFRLSRIVCHASSKFASSKYAEEFYLAGISNESDATT
jgi:hypothetical protein